MRSVKLCGSALALCALAALLGAGSAGAATGAISGQVLDPTQEPLAGITVCAQATSPIGSGDCQWQTGPDGGYSIPNLSEGLYRVDFHVEGSPSLNFAQQWWDDKAHPEEATTVSVTEGATTEHIDATMQTGGQISGAVRSATNGDPIPGVEVCARLVGYFQTGEVGYCGHTDGSGEYHVKNLGGGEYTVEFRTQGNANFIAANYPTHVPVTAGQVSEGIDVQLQPGLEIEGAVTDAATGAAPEVLFAPYSAISVCALEPVTERRVLCDWIEEDGHYAIAGLPPGDYVVAFATDTIEEGYDLHPDGYLKRYWDEVPSFDEANLVEFPTPGVLSGIDAALTRGEEGTGICGITGPCPPPGGDPSGDSSSPSVGAATTIVGPSRPVLPFGHGGPKKVVCRKTFRKLVRGGRTRCVKIRGKHHPRRNRRHR
jgi:hypothetical protein